MENTKSKKKEEGKNDETKKKFNWNDFNLEKFFKDANKVGEILRKTELEIKNGKRA